MLNILASAKNIPVAVLENVNYQGRLAYGNKKNRTFVCNSFLNYMREIDITDIIISEGLSFNIAQKPKFKKVLGLSRNVSNTYSSQKKYHIQKNT